MGGEAPSRKYVHRQENTGKTGLLKLALFTMRVLFRHSFFGRLHENENRILNAEIRFSSFNFHKL